MNRADTNRFWAKVARASADECWDWTASVNVRGGYGQFKTEGRVRRAHIVAYELAVGPMPEGLVLDHTCRNRRCVNPAHLEPVTQAENNRRGMSPSAVAVRNNRCTRGHEFTPENAVTRTNGHRKCRVCEREAERRRRRQAREETSQ